MRSTTAGDGGVTARWRLALGEQLGVALAAHDAGAQRALPTFTMIRLTGSEAGYTPVERRSISA